MGHHTVRDTLCAITWWSASRLPNVSRTRMYLTLQWHKRGTARRVAWVRHDMVRRGMVRHDIGVEWALREAVPNRVFEADPREAVGRDDAHHALVVELVHDRHEACSAAQAGLGWACSRHQSDSG